VHDRIMPVDHHDDHRMNDDHGIRDDLQSESDSDSRITRPGGISDRTLSQGTVTPAAPLSGGHGDRDRRCHSAVTPGPAVPGSDSALEPGVRS
jgi:hypothetical protein